MHHHHHQQQQQDGGSHYGAPPSQESPLAPSAVGARPQLLVAPTSSHIPQLQPEAAPPISVRAPVGPMDFDELAPAVAGTFPDDDAVAAGEDAERGGSVAGYRWPREETLALLKVRSEMDAAFRDATLKGPLWEEISRKLAEQGYRRSGKKCKEKFDNVHKYYKRTKEGRAGRQDGKSYRFFSELEALYCGGGYTSIHASSTSTTNFTGSGTVDPTDKRAHTISAVAPPTMDTPTRVVVPDSTPPGGAKGISSSAAATIAGMLFSPFSSSSSLSTSDSEGEETEEAAEREEGQMRKRGRGSLGPRKKMMVLFDRLMGQVMERQEAMQQRFLDAIEKREQDRMIREEAWRRQEMARLSREQELIAQERANTESRETAIITYLQNISGQPIHIPSPIPTTPATPIRISPQTPSAIPIQSSLQPPPAPATKHIAISDAQDATAGSGVETASSSSRWPKAEVHALINLRSGLETNYQESGSKGTLWEEMSVGMQRLGYNRSAKRCKEKWENINKYFKKVKESNKKRPEDSKTCPYFHQLDALYRNKLLIGSSGNASDQQEQQRLQAPPPLEQQHQTAADAEINNIGKNSSNAELPPSFFSEGSDKPEGIVKEPMGQTMNESDGADSMEQDYDDNDDDEENEERKLRYMVQFQSQNTVNTSGRGTPPVTAAGAAKTAGSLLAIVQ